MKCLCKLSEQYSNVLLHTARIQRSFLLFITFGNMFELLGYLKTSKLDQNMAGRQKLRILTKSLILHQKMYFQCVA